MADTLPRSAPTGGAPAGWALRERLTGQRRGADRRPHLVTISLRVEADEEELVAGAVRLVLQVHDEQDPLHVRDAVDLWTRTEEEHGFGERARVHATLALRGAAEGWPVLDRLLELQVPDQITLDTDELVSLLDTGVAALRDRSVDVLWPRSLGRDLTTTTVLDRRPDATREEPLVEGLLGRESLFSFHWQVALHGDPLSADEMDRLAAATTPLLKLRDQWMVVDPAVARRAKRRLVRTVTPVQAVAAALTGVVEVDDVDHDVVVGASLLAVREQLRTAAVRDPIEPPPGLRATLRDYQRHGLTWLVQLTDLGLGACLADDMGLGKTVTLIALHLHRGGPTLVVCPASLLGTWESEIHRFAPGVPVRRFHGSQRDLSGLDAGGFVLTTYGTMRTSAPALTAASWDLVVADEAQHVKNPQSSTARALRTIPSAARVALTGTPVENNLTELWAILDWATPGLLGSRGAFRKVWAGPIESGLEPTKARLFADLIGPFLLRRRKSDPGVAPELPAKTETDHVLGLTREQVVLYEAFVRDTMERIARADEETRRGLVLALLTGLKQICNHPAQFLKQANPRLAGPLAQAGHRRRAGGDRGRRGRRGARLHAVRRHGPAARDPPDPQRCPPPVPARRHPGAGARGDGGPLPGGRGPGLPAVAARGWHRPHPDPGRPRDPPGPVVEPRGRGAGDRPRLPDRPDQAGPGAPAGHPGDHRGAHRRAARPQARAGRLRAGPRPRRPHRAHRAQRRRPARPGHAPAARRVAGS